MGHDEDMDSIFKLMDSDGSGTVDRDEFVDQLYKMKNDTQVMLMFLKYYVLDIKAMTTEQLKNQKDILIQGAIERDNMLKNVIDVKLDSINALVTNSSEKAN